MTKQIKNQNISAALQMIFKGIEMLREGFNSKRQFTIDGRLVGDIGEIIAELEYDIEIDEKSQPTHDGTTSCGRRVQVKSTFQDQLTFKGGYDLYLGLKLHKDGTFEEIYNGPGHYITKQYSHRKGIGTTLLSFPIGSLKKLQKRVPMIDKVKLRMDD